MKINKKNNAIKDIAPYFILLLVISGVFYIFSMRKCI